MKKEEENEEEIDKIVAKANLIFLAIIKTITDEKHFFKIHSYEFKRISHKEAGKLCLYAHIHFYEETRRQFELVVAKCFTGGEIKLKQGGKEFTYDLEKSVEEIINQIKTDLNI